MATTSSIISPQSPHMFHMFHLLKWHMSRPSRPCCQAVAPVAPEIPRVFGSFCRCRRSWPASAGSHQFEPFRACTGYGVCTANKSKVNWLLNLHPGPSRKCDSTCYRDTWLQSFEMQSSHCGHQGSGNVFLKPANLGHGRTDGQSW